MRNALRKLSGTSTAPGGSWPPSPASTLQVRRNHMVRAPPANQPAAKEDAAVRSVPTIGNCSETSQTGPRLPICDPMAPL